MKHQHPKKPSPTTKSHQKRPSSSSSHQSAPIPRLHPSRCQFCPDSANSHESLTFSRPQYHTIRCKVPIERDYLSALSEQQFLLPRASENVSESKSHLEWKFRLDKDMKISDLFIGIVFEPTTRDSEGSVFPLTMHIGETANSYAMWCFDSSLWHNDTRTQRKRANGNTTSGTGKIAGKEIENTEPIEELIAYDESLNGGLYERIARGSQISMRVSLTSSNTHLLQWQVNSGEWFGFDSIVVPEDVKHVRVGVSFGMSGLQISALK